MSAIESDCRMVKSRLDTGESVLLLDCREQDEWDLVHIDGATLLPMSEIQQRVGELEHHRGSEIIVYCHHGGRSLQVAMWLRQKGFSNACSMSGGIDVWAQEIECGMARY